MKIKENNFLNKTEPDEYNNNNNYLDISIDEINNNNYKSISNYQYELAK